MIHNLTANDVSHTEFNKTVLAPYFDLVFARAAIEQRVAWFQKPTHCRTNQSRTGTLYSMTWSAEQLLWRGHSDTAKHKILPLGYDGAVGC